MDSEDDFMKKDPKCPDCGKIVPESMMRTHIRNCDRYVGLAYKQVKRLPNNIPTEDLKVTTL